MNKKNNSKNYLGNTDYVQVVIKGPEFATTTPGQLQVYGEIQPSQNKPIIGEAPYNRGELMNVLVNLDNNKQPQTNNKDNAELYQAMYMKLKGVKFNPGGILLKAVQEGASYKYMVNTALVHANLSAIQAKQNMSLMQLTELNWFTNAKPAVKSNIEATTIALLAIPHNTAILLDSYLSVANVYAFVTAMVTDDRDNTSHWQSLQSTFARRTFVSKVSLLSATADNLYLSTTAIKYIKSLKRVNKASKGLNSPYTTLELDFENQVDNLRINTTGQDVAFQNCTSFALNFTEERKAFDIYKVIQLVEYMAGKRTDAPTFTFVGQDNTITIRTPRELIDLYERVLTSMQTKISALVAINADFYAALAVINSSGILNKDFAKNQHILKDFQDVMSVGYNLNHIAMLTTATSYVNLEISTDSQNNVELNVPTVLNLRPYRDFDDNGILAFIDIGSNDYIPIVDWLKTRIEYVIPWVKKANTQTNLTDKWLWQHMTMYHDASGIPYFNEDVTGATNTNLTKRIYYTVMNKLSPWLTNYAYKLSGSQNNPTLFYMRSPVITRFIRYSYKSIANQIVDDAPLAIGLNKVSPLDAFQN